MDTSSCAEENGPGEGKFFMTVWLLGGRKSESDCLKVFLINATKWIVTVIVDFPLVTVAFIHIGKLIPFWYWFC